MAPLRGIFWFGLGGVSPSLLVMLLADGFGDAFVGVGRQASRDLAVYDEDKCIEVLVSGGCTYEEAREHFEFNVVGSYVGEDTPIFVKTSTLHEVMEDYGDE